MRRSGVRLFSPAPSVISGCRPLTLWTALSERRRRRAAWSPPPQAGARDADEFSRGNASRRRPSRHNPGARGEGFARTPRSASIRSSGIARRRALHARPARRQRTPGPRFAMRTETRGATIQSCIPPAIAEGISSRLQCPAMTRSRAALFDGIVAQSRRFRALVAHLTCSNAHGSSGEHRVRL